MSFKWALLDRDGTIVERHHYLLSPEQVSLIDGTVEGMATLQSQGWKFGVVTNQSPVARGLISPKGLEAIHAEMIGQLEARGVSVEFVVHCPHRPSDECGCRKPKLGLLRQAISLGFAPYGAWMVGDSITDVQFGSAAGLKTVLIGGEVHEVSPTIHVNSFVQAVPRMVGG